MNEVAYISDGYTRPLYVAAIPRLYPAVRATFRPMLSAARAVISDRISKSDPRKGESIAAEVIATHVSEWDVKADGESVELTAPNVLHLQPRLMTKLFQIVIGNLPPDQDPDADDGAACEDAARELAAALAGVSPEDHDAKN